MRLPWRFALVAAIVPLAGCVSRLDHHHVEGTFQGVAQCCERALAAGGVVRLVTIHGVGDPGPLYSDGLARGLASRLVLARRPHSETTWSIDASGLVVAKEGAAAELGSVRVSRFEGLENPAERLEIWEIDWSPATRLPKRRYLAEDDVERADRPRVYFNRVLKKDLVNGRLSDALLYAGPFREIMQKPVRLVLEEIFRRDDPERDEIVFVAESLGSSMLLDVLGDLTADPSFAPPPVAVDGHVDGGIPRSASVYSFANQLPLMRMADTASASGIPLGDQPSLTAPEVPERLHLDVIVMSDPNDLLSYSISETLAAELSRVGGLGLRFVNVTVNVAQSAILGVLANPVTAHTGHAASAFIMDLVAFGTRD